MGKPISRRKLLRDLGAAGATTLLAAGSVKPQRSAEEVALAGQSGQPTPHQQPQSASDKKASSLSPRIPGGPSPHDLVRFTTGEMEVVFDRRYGSIFSISQHGDPLKRNFIGNEFNTPGVDALNSRWTGDLVTAVWDVTDTNPAHRKWTPRSSFVLKGKWRPELTGRSADIRRVNFDGQAFSVNYDGASANEDGIRSFSLSMRFHPGEGSSLLWDIELRNIGDRVLELGDLGFPLMVNDDQGELLRGSADREAVSS